jgi:hypothetical protein
VFVWINLAISDWFGAGRTLDLNFQRMPARDLTTSIAWALYGLALLALGVRARSAGLRWLSLGLVMLTVVKVFLYDLGELEDLYRVASLLGLAVSLILVSPTNASSCVRFPRKTDDMRLPGIALVIAVASAARRDHRQAVSVVSRQAEIRRAGWTRTPAATPSSRRVDRISRTCASDATARSRTSSRAGPSWASARELLPEYSRRDAETRARASHIANRSFQFPSFGSGGWELVIETGSAVARR